MIKWHTVNDTKGKKHFSLSKQIHYKGKNKLQSTLPTVHVPRSTELKKVGFINVNGIVN
jgi:hypothetical protein